MCVTQRGEWNFFRDRLGFSAALQRCNPHSESVCLSLHWTAHSLWEVSPGARLLGSVRLGDAEGVAECRYAGLQVELGGLREIRLLAEVVEVEERGATLHLSLHQGRRSDLHRGEAAKKQVLENTAACYMWQSRVTVFTSPYQPVFTRAALRGCVLIKCFNKTREPSCY